MIKIQVDVWNVNIMGLGVSGGY